MACKLLPGLFGVAVQCLLFLMSISVLAYKKKTEEWRMGAAGRDWPTFITDSSKQLMGAGWVHVVNLTCASLLGAKFEGDGCDWYWINIMIDTTIGVGIEYMILYVLTEALEASALLEEGTFRTGEYVDAGGKFSYVRYSAQLAVWLACVTGMKVIVMTFMFLFHGPLQKVADTFLDLFEKGGPQMQLVVVMLLTPCLMNAFQFWLTDNFIKKRSKAVAEGGYELS
mmetsp:Transcript_7006/g.18849  ORF Transcript_7006/g.18849 Transcript_7006/m.18849 type:complete len:226 (-) Transcript_7006:70-747(-)